MATNTLDDRITDELEDITEVAEELEQIRSPVQIPPETLEFFGNDELRARVFYEKYALKDPSGAVVERTPVEMWGRIARELASVEQNEEKQREWEKKFFWLLENFRFIPGGRIMFGAGQARRSTLLNCYYLPIKSDSLESIFDFCKEAGRTYSFGGGVGTDISILRPRGAPVNNSAIVSTGSVSFMELFSITTGTIGQAGRRGALMITIHVDHPDVVDFIDVKRDLAKVTHANISVCITNAFMRAVDSDGVFNLNFKNDKADVKRTVRARELWDKLVRSAWASAEPGIIFWDNVKDESPTEYNGMEVRGFNPCSEQCLEDYGCCCLGNINLALFVRDEFTSRARVDWENLETALRYATRFLDNVLDYNSDKHPLEDQRKASLWSRRIGVGFTGLADMFIKLNLKYDSQESIQFTDKMFERIKNICYDESSNIAKEKGSAPAFIASEHLRRPFVRRLSPDVKEKIEAQGIRNCCILTVPPVGSGAILAGTTSGIEPIFALSYVRRSKSLSGSEFKVYHPLVKEYMKKFGIQSEDDLPEIFVTAHNIEAAFRVKMQGTIQRHIDSSISSTVNIPKEATVEQVKQIYFDAWEAGCKGITVYREGAREGILLTEAEAAEQQKSIGEKSSLLSGGNLLTGESGKFERGRVLLGHTIKMKLPQGSLYVTANKNGDDIIRETFVTLGKSGGDEKAGAEAMGRLISLYLQHGGSIKDVIHTLKGIQGRDVSWDNGQQLLSVPDAVAKALEALAGMTVNLEPELKHCPDCGESAIIFENGCYRCTSCGYSKCS
jgi:ribonucleoside-diphosphate reductase alpha chain